MQYQPDTRTVQPSTGSRATLVFGLVTIVMILVISAVVGLVVKHHHDADADKRQDRETAINCVALAIDNPDSILPRECYP